MVEPVQYDKHYDSIKTINEYINEIAEEGMKD